MNAEPHVPLQLLDTPAFTGQSPGHIRWLWKDFLAPGMITLMTSRWKSGKTTLLSILLARKSDRGTFCGTPVAPFRAAVVTEEDAQLWAERDRLLGLPPDTQWLSRPFLTQPTTAQWEAMIARLAESPAELAVIDPLGTHLPGEVENNPSALLKALAPLRQLTQAGKAVLLIHHPSKKGTRGELSPRGTGALTAFADILVELDRVHDRSITDRRRKLKVVSRATGPSTRVIELNADGAEYTVVPDVIDLDSFEDNWPVLLSIFVDDDNRLSRQGILQQWPGDYEKPPLSTLRRWLDQAEKERKLERRGTGRRNNPFVYSLPYHVDLYDPIAPFQPQKVRVGFQPDTHALSLEELAAMEQRGDLKWKPPPPREQPVRMPKI